MEYLHVLSRPMVINHDHDIIWTEAYMDTKVGALAAAPGFRVGVSFQARNLREQDWTSHIRRWVFMMPPWESPGGDD